jgi:hypothetical protein
MHRQGGDVERILYSDGAKKWFLWDLSMRMYNDRAIKIKIIAPGWTTIFTSHLAGSILQAEHQPSRFLIDHHEAKLLELVQK